MYIYGVCSAGRGQRAQNPAEWWGLTPVSLSWSNKFWAPRAPTAERITGRAEGRLGAEVLALDRWTNTNNDINNETLKTHNCVREREREREKERESWQSWRGEKCTQRNPFRDSLVWWLPGFLTRGMEQWNSVKNPPETKVSHRVISTTPTL